ncbi:MAG: potassium transporter Kup [Bacteroidales bacterium]|nr:MAG: potassium transporter Kup [Bacteroidales bacterium]
MHITDNQNIYKKLSFSGLLVTLGIVYGDIGTSPLYVMKAIIGEGVRDSNFIIGAISCIIWTLTLQTTIKYIWITLKADNKGEGGILSLFALLRKKRRYVYIIAMVGASTLLADGIITPSITVVSAVEGLGILYPHISVIPIVVVILAFLFLFQQFGTELIGRSYGPIMVIWFSTLAILGFSQLIHYPQVLAAFNPYYAVKLLIEYPGGILILGAVFLCTTGADALYSDLGHCGVKNIRVSWIFVKISLIINYLGQGAWIIINSDKASLPNPFFAIMPQWFVLPGVILATMAAIIASQAMITSSYTIISEAITLNIWPKVKIKYPGPIKGQMYIPSTNWVLFFSCIFVVSFFQTSSNMEAMYGLTINITMLMTSLLMLGYLQLKRTKMPLIILFITTYLTIEGAFLYANLHKFHLGGWFTVFLAGLIFFIMFIWNRGRLTKKQFTQFYPISDFTDLFKDIQKDNTLPRYATNLVYITRAEQATDVERKIIYSIFNKQPKRAERYWFLHINITDEPYTKEYRVRQLIPDVLYRIDFNIGFKVNPRINRFFNHVISDLVKSGEVDITSKYYSLSKHNVPSDFRFIIIDRVLTVDTELTTAERFVMNAYDVVKKFSMSSVNAYGLDTSNVMIEQVPLGIVPLTENGFKRL